ncbi:MAG: hypothetical protein AB7T49_04170 [Oligoflexales bacterium]
MFHFTKIVMVLFFIAGSFGTSTPSEAEEFRACTCSGGSLKLYNHGEYVQTLGQYTECLRIAKDHPSCAVTIETDNPILRSCTCSSGNLKLYANGEYVMTLGSYTSCLEIMRDHPSCR